MIRVNLQRAKDEVAHPIRRVARSEAFKPVDGDSPYATLNEAGEALRAEIKAKDDAAQIAIDAATTEAELKQIMIDEGYING